MAALALERIDLSLRLSEAHAHARTEELKSALLASVSHDLRSPLTAISASAASLLTFGPQFDRETSHELLDGIVKEAARLNDLTTNLLQMTRLEAGEEGLSWSLLPVGESLRAIMGRVQRHRQTHPMTLHMPAQELLVRTDSTLFDLAVTNVLQNAIRYSPAGSPITIECSAQGEGASIAISDEGYGIPPAEQEKVFDRFYRLARDARVPQGSGWGWRLSGALFRRRAVRLSLNPAARWARNAHYHHLAVDGAGSEPHRRGHGP
jgi:two-component system sensor histidine kinase KdpD